MVDDEDHLPKTKTLRRLDPAFGLFMSQNTCIEPKFQHGPERSNWVD